MISLDILRARHAMTMIEQVRQYQTPQQEEGQNGSPKLYGSYVKSLPASIVQVGLGQAMATLLAKAKGKSRDGNFLLYTHVQEWLCLTAEHSPYFAPDAAPDLLDAIMKGTEDQYIRGQTETMAYLNWLKKFAVAQLKDEGHG